MDVFEIDNKSDHKIWAESDGDEVVVCRSDANDKDSYEVLVRWSASTIRSLVIWADSGNSVTAVVTGPMAQQVKDQAQKLMLTPEMFIWHAVKLFIEVGESEKNN